VVLAFTGRDRSGQITGAALKRVIARPWSRTQVRMLVPHAGDGTVGATCRVVSWGRLRKPAG
jgi:hypothetical protein